MDPADGFWLTRVFFLRGLAAIYLIAFLVTANQFRPLLGERGLLPVARFLERSSPRRSPSLFWLAYSDRLAAALAWSGVGLSALALLGVPGRLGTAASVIVWALLWVLYLSFVNVGQTFYAYGWESLLLETGFLAVFLGGTGTQPPEIVIWLLRWTLFRVMFGAGLIKLRGDECWRELTCLRWHYETQPLPNPLSWWLHRSPMWLHRAGAAATHFIQLAVPLFYFLPAPFRWAAGGLTLLFQGSLILSGNLSWLNWLTALLAVACFDDALLATILPLEVPDAGPTPLPLQAAAWAYAAVVAVLSVRPVRNLFSKRQLMNARFDPFHLVNAYGAFGSVTRRRLEVVLEGTAAESVTADTEWREYEFKGKPGDLGRPPPMVAPYHLRLDWQMWFAAMSAYHDHPWIVRLATRLLEGDPATLALLAGNPFPDAPPGHVRGRLYLYRFTSRDERRRTGRWWTRSPVGEYLPVLSRGAVAGPTPRAGAA